jgi:hypothetical protein
MFRRRRRRSVLSRGVVGRRNSNNLALYLFIAIGGLLALWILIKISGMLVSSVQQESTSASLKEATGRTEFQLEDSDTWNMAFPGATFLAGDKIRTGNKSYVEFQIFDGTTFFLNENSELRFDQIVKGTDSKNKFFATLIKGEIWAKVSEEDFSAENKAPNFKIDTTRSTVYVRGTAFDLSHSDIQDTIHLIKGQVDVDIKDLQNTENPGSPLNTSVGVGQKLVINSETYTKAQNGENLLDAMDADFGESEWHLKNLEKFFPEEAKKIQQRIEVDHTIRQATEANANTPDATDNAEAGDPSVASPQIISPTEGSSIPATEDRITIEGSAPTGTYQIEVNDYTLTKFQPGDRKWSYFASAQFGTLKPGENIYKIVAVTHEGKRSLPAVLRVNYEKKPEPNNPNATSSTDVPIPDENPTGSGPENVTYANPVITSPAIFQSDSNAIYQTSSSVVTIRGIVPNNTEEVIINGFRLKKFKLGDTKFSYIANASYKNMKEGENIYTIQARSAQGQIAKTTIKIIYTPLVVQ